MAEVSEQSRVELVSFCFLPAEIKNYDGQDKQVPGRVPFNGIDYKKGTWCCNADYLSTPKSNLGNWRESYNQSKDNS